MPPVDRDAPTSRVSTTAGGGATDPTLTSAVADVGLGLLAAVAALEAEGVPVVDADGVAVDDEVAGSDGEADGTAVFPFGEESDGADEAEADGTEEADVEVVVAVVGTGVGEGSGVGLAAACGTMTEMARITIAGKAYHGPNLEPAGVLDAT